MGTGTGATSPSSTFGLSQQSLPISDPLESSSKELHDPYEYRKSLFQRIRSVEALMVLGSMMIALVSGAPVLLLSFLAFTSYLCLSFPSPLKSTLIFGFLGWISNRTRIPLFFILPFYSRESAKIKAISSTLLPPLVLFLSRFSFLSHLLESLSLSLISLFTFTYIAGLYITIIGGLVFDRFGTIPSFLLGAVLSVGGYVITGLCSAVWPSASFFWLLLRDSPLKIYRISRLSGWCWSPMG